MFIERGREIFIISFRMWILFVGRGLDIVKVCSICLIEYIFFLSYVFYENFIILLGRRETMKVFMTLGFLRILRIDYGWIKKGGREIEEKLFFKKYFGIFL